MLESFNERLPRSFDFTSASFAGQEREEPRGQVLEETPKAIVHKDENGANCTTYFISHTLKNVMAYAQLCTHLYTASAEEKIKLIITTPGGDVRVGQIIADAIKITKAEVTTVASGLCASCGAIIWALGDVLVAEDWAIIMFHMSMHDASGKTLDILNTAECIVDSSASLYAPILKRNILTEEEYSKMTNRKINIYITGKEMQRRLSSISEVK